MLGPMKSRQLVIVSMLMYALACALPALQWVDSVRPKEPTLGIHCLTYLGYWGAMAEPFPFLFIWAVNPWLWVLWVRAYIGKPTSLARWGVVVLAVASTKVLSLAYNPLVGTWLWIASAAVGAYASGLPRDSRASVPIATSVA
jgi:hypothetical protein